MAVAVISLPPWAHSLDNHTEKMTDLKEEIPQESRFLESSLAPKYRLEFLH